MVKIRVLVVDIGWSVGREALVADCELELKIVEAFEEAVSSLATFRPRVIVAALASSPSGEAEALERLIRTAGVPLLVVTEPADDQRMTRLLKAGASGYLFASDANRQLAVAVRELVRGGMPMSPPAARMVLARARRSSSQMAAVRLGGPEVQSLLSGRQAEVLALLAGGHSYDDIALALDLSVNTVRTYVRAIYERLGVNTKVEAVVVATGIGLLPRPNAQSAGAAPIRRATIS